MRSIATKKRLNTLGAGPAGREAADLFARLKGLSLRRSEKLSRDEVTYFFSSLATLIGNGVPLAKALTAIEQEKSLERRKAIFAKIRRQIEAGGSFSQALQTADESFDSIVLSQVRVGERAGALAECLANIAEQRKQAGRLREEVLKKLAYPVTLAVIGSGVVAFLLAYVVPVFEETYRKSQVPLPWITRFLIQIGSVVQTYWWAVLLAVATSFLVFGALRRREALARAMDDRILRLPLLGPWIRDAALLQLMDVLGNLMGAGFTLAEALREASDSVSNRAMKAGAVDLQRAVQRGERFSRQVETHAALFPPMVSQLIIVGEQTGNLVRATSHVREHLRHEIERKSTIAVGVIEPVLTIGLASAVAAILLAIYLPMFDMINTVG
ncbi:Type II secretion system protein F [Pseudobythopirellula maris]|uniref:Type II secretion system protein F n=1 Tax=Pseudobythopirellula maris TaxID=2527991 RepID=A0A5C5ZS55_9BACT|nr:type II secretion system F family protein [Pseudobythopirellula maris]TWT89915.1 Type II secretion system protein F [Pseudobythopirellula maris]